MLLWIVLIAALFQQTPPTTGTIEAMVVRNGTSYPIAGVKVKATPGGSSVPIETVTDGAGHFILRDIPAGPVAIEASVDGYLFSNPFSNPVLRFSVNLAAGQNMKLPNIPATKASTIRGRVVDEDGHGIAGVSLSFVQSVAVDAQGNMAATISALGAVRTNDEGEYSHDMLPPGEYFVRANINRPSSSGLTVYFPSTTNLVTAAPVRLSEGAEMTADIRITKDLEPNTFKISGRVLPLPGKTVPSSVWILLRGTHSRANAADTVTDSKTGAFELPGIPPGSYDLFASANIVDKEYLSKVSVFIRDRDAEDIEVTLQPAMDIQGRLITDVDSKDLQLQRRGVGSVKLALIRQDGLFGIQPVIDDEGIAFTFRDVPQGNYNIAVTFAADRGHAPSPDLYVADIRASGRSVFDRGLEVGLDPTDSLEVVIGSNGGSVAGSVVGSIPRQGTLVLLAPEFARRDNPSLFRFTAAGPEGQFQLRGLTPGTYKMFAVPSGTPLTFLNPDYLARYEPHALTVVVQKGVPVSGLRVPLVTLAGR